MSTPYINQVELLVNLLPIVEKQTCFALKGGTAINLFLRNMPRLSVDIDLAYLPIETREKSLEGIDKAIGKIAEYIEKRIPNVQITPTVLKGTGKRYKLLVQQAQAHVKIEVTPVLRGSVYPSEKRRISKNAEQRFGFATMTLLSFEDLFAGKICAALDRQHPRDLFDIYWLLNNEGINEQVKNAFLVYLMGHNRPMAELLAPMPKSAPKVYQAEFEGMAFTHINLEQLEGVLPTLSARIHNSLNDVDKRFLMDLKLGTQNWESFVLPEAEKLPAIQWKMQNLARMTPEKRKQAADKLEKILYG